MQLDTQPIGFIGAGYLADFMIRGLRHGGFQGDILLTPRSIVKAEQLRDECGCIIASAESILEQCTLVGLAVRPTQVEATLKPLKFNDKHVIISYVAAVDIAQISRYTKHKPTIVRTMPISAAAVSSSPTLIFPAHSATQQLLSYCGNPIVLKRESDFEIGSVMGCVYASLLDFYGSLCDNLHQLGMDETTSRQLIYGVLAGAVDMAAFDIEQDAHDLSAEVAVEGSYSKICLDNLKRNDALQPWTDAIQLIHSKLTS